MDKYLPHIPISLLAEDDKPREKLNALGRSNLSDAELMAILIGSGSRNETAVQLAQRILANYNNNLNTLAKVGINELQKFKGVGLAKATAIVAAMELARRKKSDTIEDVRRITQSNHAFEYIKQYLQDKNHEEFYAIYTSRNQKIIGHEQISSGGITATIVDIRIILKHAIDKLAVGIIIAHNHPSGNNSPSQPDDVITKKLKASCETMDISLLDHLIVCDSNYYSYADSGHIL